MLPLALTLVARIDDRDDRLITIVGVTVCAVGAAIVGLAPVLEIGLYEMDSAMGLLVAGITVIPGIIAAGPMIPGGRRGTLDGAEAAVSGRVLQSTELAIAGVTPAVALAHRPLGQRLAVPRLGRRDRSRGPLHRPAARPARQPRAAPA